MVLHDCLSFNVAVEASMSGLTYALRERTIDQLQTGARPVDVAALLGMSVSTIRRPWQRFSTTAAPLKTAKSRETSKAKAASTCLLIHSLQRQKQLRKQSERMVHVLAAKQYVIDCAEETFMKTRSKARSNHLTSTVIGLIVHALNLEALAIHPLHG